MARFANRWCARGSPRPGVTVAVMLRELDSGVLLRLLDLQAHDSAIKRLWDQRDTLPEKQRLGELRDNLAELEADIAIARQQSEDAARVQSRLEGEIALADEKIQRQEARLFAGSVSNPRELSSLQAEVAMLKRQRAASEDELLEAMVHRDTVDQTLGSLTTEQVQSTRAAEDLGVTVTRLTGDIESELASHTKQRDSVATAIPADLLDLYEKIRATKGGVGAAALKGGTCQGCHTQLPAKEAERIRAEGGLQRCDNCRRILVVV